MLFGNPSVFGSRPHICGCYFTLPNNSLIRHYLPQVKLESHTTLTPVSFTTNLTQTFHNGSSDLIPQVRYTFPLYDGVAVNGYVISYAGKQLKSLVKQKDVAKQIYQAATDRGEAAGLLESLPAGIIGVTLGNVPPRTDIVVEITYCGELKHDAGIDGLRWTLPTSIAPRYGEYPGQILNDNGIASSGIKITVDADMAGSAIRKLMSPSHPISVSMGATSKTESTGATFQPSQASAELALGTTELGDDFVVQLLIDDIGKPQAIVETHPSLPNQRALMVTLVPKFVLPSANPEIVFIADQSGSMMGGDRNNALVKALNVFLKSLPLGVRFNICAFGNDFKYLWPKSQAYNETNLNQALGFVNSFKADYGGTEILEPIKAAFKQRLADLPLEVMLLTDGQVWGEEGIFSFLNSEINEKKIEARVFTLGIGAGVSHTLVEGVARISNGFSQFVTENEQTTDQKVIRMLKAALYGHTENYSLEVNYKDDQGQAVMDDDEFEIVEKVNECLVIQDPPTTVPEVETTKENPPTSFFDQTVDLDKPIDKDLTTDRYAHLPAIESPKILQAPSTIPPLFPFNRTTVYLLLGPETTPKKIASVTLRATCSTGPLELTIPVFAAESTEVPTIHQLAARKAIQGLEEGRGWLQTAKSTNAKGESTAVKTKYESRFDEIVEREVVHIGERYQVISKWTSFVAIENEEDDQNPQNDTRHTDTLERPTKHCKDLPFPPSYVQSAFQDAPAPHPIRSARRIGVPPARNANLPSVAHQPPPAPMPSFNAAMYSGAMDTMGSGSLASRGTPLFASANARSATTSTSGGLFGGTAHSTSLKSGGLFRSPAADSTSVRSGGLFGSTTRSSAAPTSGGLFGGAAANFTSSSGNGGLFGSAAPPPQNPVASSGGLFGQPGQPAPAAPTTNSLFGQPLDHRKQSPQNSRLFGHAAIQQGQILRSHDTEPAPVEPSSIDPLHPLIALQSFSGAWGWDPALFALLSLSESQAEEFKHSVEREGGRPMAEEVYATAMAVAFLQAKLAAQKEVWDMVEQKAVEWLTGEVPIDVISVGGLVEKAKRQLF